MHCRFPFEAEFHETVEFMPLGLRRKLDLSSLKLSLAVWQALSVKDRVFLRDLPAQTDHEVGEFRVALRRLALRAGFDVQEVEFSKDALRWRELSAPAIVRSRLAALHVERNDDRWAGLDDEGRYVLVRLASSRRDNGRLALACAVLGLDTAASIAGSST